MYYRNNKINIFTLNTTVQSTALVYCQANICQLYFRSNFQWTHVYVLQYINRLWLRRFLALFVTLLTCLLPDSKIIAALLHLLL